MRPIPKLALGALLAALSIGCSYTAVGRGDLAWEGVKYDKPPIPLTVAVSAFESKGGSDVTPDAVFAFSRSYLTVLEETGLFKGVYASVEAPDADVRFEGSVSRISIYENNWYLASWVILGVATFGLFPGIGALLGLPYATENGDIYLAIRAVDGKTGAVIANYETEWDDTLVFNIYNSGSNTKETFYAQPKRAVQAATAKNVEAVIADRARYEAMAQAKGQASPPAAPPAAPGVEAAAPASAPAAAGPGTAPAIKPVSAPVTEAPRPLPQGPDSRPRDR